MTQISKTDVIAPSTSARYHPNDILQQKEKKRKEKKSKEGFIYRWKHICVREHDYKINLF